jgi:hypothetical protein
VSTLNRIVYPAGGEKPLPRMVRPYRMTRLSVLGAVTLGVVTVVLDPVVPTLCTGVLVDAPARAMTAAWMLVPEVVNVQDVGSLEATFQARRVWKSTVEVRSDVQPVGSDPSVLSAISMLMRTSPSTVPVGRETTAEVAPLAVWALPRMVGVATPTPGHEKTAHRRQGQEVRRARSSRN